MSLLLELANKTETDKHTTHSYIELYESILSKKKILQKMYLK